MDADTCYVISGKDLVLYDISDVASPLVISSHRIDVVNVRDVYSSGPYVYLITLNDGFWIYDKTDDFQLVGSYQPDSRLSWSFVTDGRAYLTCFDGLRIVDISQADNPVLLTKYAREGGVGMVYVRDGICYAGSHTGLVTLDVSDPMNIIELDTVEISDHSGILAVEDTLAYVTAYGPVPTYLAVVDVSDPHDMGLLGSTGIDYDIAFTFAPIYVHGGYTMMTCHSSIFHSGGQHIIDARNPESMEEVGYYPVDSPLDAGISFPYALVTNHDGLRVIDFSVPSEPEEVGFIDGDHYVADIYTREGFSYIADGPSGFSILDIRDPYHPQAIYVDTSTSINDVTVNGSYAYLACSTSQLRILNITDPFNPEEESSIDAGNAVSVDVEMPYAYVAGGDGLHIIEVSNVDSLFEVGFLPMNFLKEIVVSGDYAYLACGFDGMRIVDVEHPEDPQEISHVGALDWTTGVDISGPYAYMADGYAGVRVIDVHNPQQPVPVAQSLAGYGNRLYVVEPYLYLAAGSFGMKVLDISVPESIHEVGHYGIASLGGIFADEDYIYYGTIDNGFYIFEFTPTGIVTGDNADSNQIPKTFTLFQNYPNPFNPSTTISFEVPEEHEKQIHVSLTIYDLRGRRLRTLIDSEFQPGRHEVVWDGKNEQGGQVPSGIYLYRLESRGCTSARKMTILR